MRDLVRTRADLVDDRRRMMQRVGALLQRHGRVWRAPRWTCQHRAWLDRQSFTEPALQAALRTYLAALDTRDAELAVLETQLRGCWASVDPLASMVRRLGCYRGIAELTGLTLAAEVADFRRFASAPAFMGFTGLTPSEYSSGARTRRGAITKAGAWCSPRPGERREDPGAAHSGRSRPPTLQLLGVQIGRELEGTRSGRSGRPASRRPSTLPRQHRHRWAGMDRHGNPAGQHLPRRATPPARQSSLSHARGIPGLNNTPRYAGHASWTKLRLPRPTRRVNLPARHLAFPRPRQRGQAEVMNWEGDEPWTWARRTSSSCGR